MGMIPIHKQVAELSRDYAAWRKTGYVRLPSGVGKQGVIQPTQEEIMALLREGPLTRKQITAALPHVTYYGVQSALSKLVAADKLTRTGKRCAYLYSI